MAIISCVLLDLLLWDALHPHGPLSPKTHFPSMWYLGDQPEYHTLAAGISRLRDPLDLSLDFLPNLWALA